MLLRDKVAIVTGATRGIGKEIVKTFVEQGAFVYGIYASNHEAAREIEKTLNQGEKCVSYVSGSVDDQLFIHSLFKSVVDKHNRLDILVNNAGITRDQFLFQMDDQSWQQVLQVNFGGTYTCCHAALPYMERKKQGKIVNVVSVTGVVGREAQTNYGASKGAIIGLTRLLARKYSEKGISINAIAPGMIETEMIKQVPEEKLKNFLRFTNAKKLGSTKEVARNVLYLSSDLSDYVTDTVLKVDGGFLR
ncbi:3-oxoacyl-ACP reductase FabG [Halalkalibacterium halodurans]|uniref:3-oxoacyl-(Acyl-carrier protein) reductase n=1 Tax=Halalkalibacterium halodurans (strain ATCC BAA-125 / DSM 18197 / FERM 7344 / JCM 9153 / C-125) TaxID=272558 RepID=Q9KBT2_HALH5|nr:3-oxoacyl-ACP reductase FabG [Halalkalibacterium halodurans]MED4082291.1 3-oxoacyl-ACP reductase FabG [Halalkalibacterium halodurans]MED4083558.1 3-oxoacyl-ACP reductase FabG [Halalkalibacterium halodurans]MED4105871.1 3-oxoacyl-ACP reductase FabG [Halalkalibacterium halodurans]MED4109983.1 3-oxoacyl-ACP reductase FabG [Halalkalibacterium halodurans]MED4125004.1 3-oxoacyl-ACP reductase FabG [Halalkalibacterium halodurans]